MDSKLMQATKLLAAVTATSQVREPMLYLSLLHEEGFDFAAAADGDKVAGESLARIAKAAYVFCEVVADEASKLRGGSKTVEDIQAAIKRAAERS